MERVVITGIGLDQQVNAQMTHMFGDTVYAYVFGDRISNLRLDGVGFAAPCDGSGRPGLSGVDGIRQGVTAKLAWHVGFNKIEAGLWLENDDYHRTQNRYNVENGNPDGKPLFNERVHAQRDYKSLRETTQFFLKDTLTLMDSKLKLELGFKATDIDYKIAGYRNPLDYINGRHPILKDNWKDSFLPQVGAVYSVTGRDQIFASYSENMALPRGADDIFSAASPTVAAPEPETSTNWEIGYRANHRTFNASIVAYQTEFKNRLQSFAALVPGGGGITETFFQNVGAVRAKGVEFSGQWKPELLAGKAQRIQIGGKVATHAIGAD